MQKTTVWDKHEIKAAIGRAGHTYKSIGALYGLSGAAIASSLRRNVARPSPLADQALADFLSVPLHELFPGQYDDRGFRIRALPKLPKRPSVEKKARPGPRTELPVLPKRPSDAAKAKPGPRAEAPVSRRGREPAATSS